jgi:hypothetical protein
MTITQIEKGRLHHIQTIWAARNNNRNTEPTAKEYKPGRVRHFYQINGIA